MRLFIRFTSEKYSHCIAQGAVPNRWIELLLGKCTVFPVPVQGILTGGT